MYLKVFEEKEFGGKENFLIFYQPIFGKEDSFYNHVLHLSFATPSLIFTLFLFILFQSRISDFILCFDAVFLSFFSSFFFQSWISHLILFGMMSLCFDVFFLTWCLIEAIHFVHRLHWYEKQLDTGTAIIIITCWGWSTSDLGPGDTRAQGTWTISALNVNVILRLWRLAQRCSCLRYLRIHSIIAEFAADVDVVWTPQISCRARNIVVNNVFRKAEEEIPKDEDELLTLWSQLFPSTLVPQLRCVEPSTI